MPWFKGSEIRTKLDRDDIFFMESKFLNNAQIGAVFSLL